jgi:hypothetical protein
MVLLQALKFVFVKVAVNEAVDPTLIFIFEETQPAAEVATIIWFPAVRPVMVNGLVLYAAGGPPSTEYVPEVLDDNVIDAVPLFGLPQVVGVVTPEPVICAGAVILTPMRLETQPPAVTVATIVWLPAARPGTVNGLLLYATGEPPSKV